jgi:hypothetical protein
MANDVTRRAFTAWVKSITPAHCCRVKMPRNPAGGFIGVSWSASWKYTVFAHVPLTRMYAGPSAAANLRRRALDRSTGGRASKMAGS